MPDISVSDAGGVFYFILPHNGILTLYLHGFLAYNITGVIFTHSY